MQKLFREFENALFASASDEYNERASRQKMKERYEALQVARNRLISAIEAIEQPKQPKLP